MIQPNPRRLVPALALMALALAACGKERAPLPGAQAGAQAIDTHGPAQTPNPAASGMIAPQGALEQGQTLALKLDGIGGKAELDHALAKLKDEDARGLFEMGFRQCFTADNSKRDYAAATAAMQSVLQRDPDFAPAYRVLAYATLNTGFDMQGATKYYEKAVELDPNYGEAQYALSFMLTQSDMDRGREAFKKAMELGIPDERNLGSRFYPDVKVPPQSGTK